MHTRRSCLKGSALLALYAWAATGPRAMGVSLSGLSASAIVIDTGLPDAAVLAGRAGAQARVEMLGDDVAELFYGRLVPLWRADGVRGLAGLTRAPALFLLEALAADYGLRTVGFERAPSAGSAVVEGLYQAHERRVCSRRAKPMRDALLDRDDAPFVWLMAPLHRPIHSGVRVIPT